MGRLQTGPRTAHIAASHGPDTNIMKFYVTQNSTTYGKHWEKFKPKQGRHTGTGYLSNFRPGVYYSKRLDDVDNPFMGEVCAKNYNTITKLHYQPYKENTGEEALPCTTFQVGSGFVRAKHLTVPTVKEAAEPFIDTRIVNARTDILPRHKPLLHKIQPKDPVELENSGYGPGYMTTETHQRFTGKPADDTRDMKPKSIGHIEESGFTHAKNVEPITFNPDSPHKNEYPGWMTNRPTGVSIFKTHFLPSEYLHGNEPLPKLNTASERGSGFTREKVRPLYVHRVPLEAYDLANDVPNLRLDRTRKVDPSEYINMTHPNNHSSIMKCDYLGKQYPDQSESDRLGRTGVGNKELTGYSENNDRFVQTADNPRRFITHYMTRFQDETPVGKAREGHCRGGVQPQLLDGFTKSTSVHTYGPDVESSATLRRLEPYVGRSLVARDPFFDDHKHDSKLYRSLTMMA